MSNIVVDQKLIETGNLHFSVESRILRELGERLVKKPEVALLELIKNAYDADATTCIVDTSENDVLTVVDDGQGMTIAQFRKSWMRVATSSKSKTPTSRRFGRVITGEKGIGRFAVRFLGRRLHLISVAKDTEYGGRTKLTVDFDWLDADRNADLGKVSVPFTLETAEETDCLGTRLEISTLRINSNTIDWRQVRTGAIGVVSPLQSLFESTAPSSNSGKIVKRSGDPGFELRILSGTDEEDEEMDGGLAAQVLDNFVLRGTLRVRDATVAIRIYENSSAEPVLAVDDRCDKTLGSVSGDLRFFPRRPGTFDNSPVDGRRAYSWIKDNSGIAVFDRGFRVLPYGTENDDWLQLAADAARNVRKPRSWIAERWFPMSTPEQKSTSENWMLRLPQSAQMIGLIRVRGQRRNASGDRGLIAAADREGFVENKTFKELYQLVRATVELIAVADRKIQRRSEERERKLALEKSRDETRNAIEEVKSLPDLSTPNKKRIIARLLESQDRIEKQESHSSQRESQLQVMSLLGVIAGYMTHEFGTALTDLEAARTELERLSHKHRSLRNIASEFGASITRLEDFSEYTQLYVESTRRLSTKSFTARPRARHIVELLGHYAEERGIDVEIGVERNLAGPAVPAALYNGVLQNLFTNALKAVSARRGANDLRIAIRAWNDAKWHYLQVSDTGIGIPDTLKKFVFDPLFTTTDANADLIGSGMGLGLSLVKSGVESFGGKVDLVRAPAKFTTCVEVRLPLSDS